MFPIPSFWPGEKTHLMTSKAPQQHVRVGVGVLVKEAGTASNRIYCGIRKGSHGDGTLALPGGHLEVVESWSDCAKREIMEEMGVSLDNIKFCHVTNDVMLTERKHYVTIFMCGTCNAQPRNMEPGKCQGWKAYTWKDLKEMDQSKLFGPLAKLVKEEPQSVLDFVSSA